MLFILAKKTKIISVAKCVTSKALALQSSTRRGEGKKVKMNRDRLRAGMSVHFAIPQFYKEDFSVVHFCQQFKVASPTT